MSEPLNDVDPGRCPILHPVEGWRCEKRRGHSGGHIVKAYWSGGGSLRWATR